ncbi:MAG: hypothetical protein QMB60_04425 [Pseudomonadales bacterium]
MRLASIACLMIYDMGASRQPNLMKYDSIKNNGRISDVNSFSPVDLRIIFSYPTPLQKSN